MKDLILTVSFIIMLLITIVGVFFIAKQSFKKCKSQAMNQTQIRECLNF